LPTCVDVSTGTNAWTNCETISKNPTGNYDCGSCLDGFAHVKVYSDTDEKITDANFTGRKCIAIVTVDTDVKYAYKYCTSLVRSTDGTYSCNACASTHAL